MWFFRCGRIKWCWTQGKAFSAQFSSKQYRAPWLRQCYANALEAKIVGDARGHVEFRAREICKKARNFLHPSGKIGFIAFSAKLQGDPRNRLTRHHFHNFWRIWHGPCLNISMKQSGRCAMRDFRRGLIIILVIWGVLVLAGCQTSGSAQPASTDQTRTFWQKLTRAPEKLTVPEGTTLEIRLNDTLSSANNRGGDTFNATLAEPVLVKGKVVIPQGATLDGQVIDATPSGHLKTPAALAVTLTSVDVGGKSYDITTSTFSRRGASHKKHDAKWIAGGAAGGALLGALLGGGKGAAIGAGLGAGGGTAGAYTTGRHDVALYSESLLRFQLEAPLTIEK
jgi:hypothetical protein